MATSPSRRKTSDWAGFRSVTYRLARKSWPLRVGGGWSRTEPGRGLRRSQNERAIILTRRPDVKPEPDGRAALNKRSTRWDSVPSSNRRGHRRHAPRQPDDVRRRERSQRVPRVDDRDAARDQRVPVEARMIGAEDHAVRTALQRLGLGNRLERVGA